MNKIAGKNSEGPTSGKTCSACGVSKAVSEFYSKGNRTDSACKGCQTKKKRAKYVANKNQDAVAGLKAVLGITTQGLGKRIRSEIEKLDEVILCLQKSKR